MEEEQKSVNVCLVEDSPADALLIQTILERSDTDQFKVNACDSLALLEENLGQTKPDVILLDLHLPDSHGLDTIEGALGLTKAVPIIVLSGLSDVEVAQKAIQSGVQDYIVKDDINPKSLARCIRFARERHRFQYLKDQFTNIMTHEVRGPLFVIRESIRQVSSGMLGEINDRQKRILDLNLQNIERLSRLTTNFLDLAKMETGHYVFDKKIWDINKVVKDLEETYSKAMKPEVQFVLDIPSDPLMVYFDYDLIMQTLVNLIGNAIKFTDQGEIKVTIREDGDTVLCSVSDTGVGISEKDLPHVFEKFSQADSSAHTTEKGSGLGLSIAKMIVEQHDGQISLESSEGQGSIFTFRLPMMTKRESFSQWIEDSCTMNKDSMPVFSVLIYNLEKPISSADAEKIAEQVRAKYDQVLAIQDKLIFILKDTEMGSEEQVHKRIEAKIKGNILSMQTHCFPEQQEDYKQLIHKVFDE